MSGLTPQKSSCGVFPLVFLVGSERLWSMVYWIAACHMLSGCPDEWSDMRIFAITNFGSKPISTIPEGYVSPMPFPIDKKALNTIPSASSQLRLLRLHV